MLLIQLTGLSGSGKTTIAKITKAFLEKKELIASGKISLAASRSILMV
jgi:adenylylsulfate kinase-like enzyme